MWKRRIPWDSYQSITEKEIKKIFRILKQKIKALGSSHWEQTMMCPILTANGTMYYLGSCNTAEPDGMCHHKCTAKSKQRGLEKGEKNMQDLTSNHGSAFLQNYQMLNYEREERKKNKRDSYIFTVERVRGQAAHNYVDGSKSSKLQNTYSFQQWPMSGEITPPRILVSSLLLSLYCLCMRKWKKFAHVAILFTPRPHCA